MQEPVKACSASMLLTVTAFTNQPTKGKHGLYLASTMNNLDFNNISRIIVDPSNENIVLASTSSGRYRLSFANKSGIFKSTDGGSTWKEVYNEPNIGSLGRVKKVLQIVEKTSGNFNILYAGVDMKKEF